MIPRQWSATFGYMALRFLLITLLSISVSKLVAHPPWGIVVDKEHNIYFADIAHNGLGSVWKLDKSGKLNLLLRDFHAHYVGLDNKGHLVTANGEESQFMARLNDHGSLDTLYHTTNYEDFNGGNCAYTTNGEIVFQAGGYIWKINKYGKKEKVSSHKFKWCQTLYTDELGNYYVPEIGDGIGKLFRIGQKGETRMIATNLISKTDKPYNKHNDILMGITKGCDDHIYVAELAGKRIIKVLENQKTETFYTSEGDWFPSGIDFFAGEAYIMEYRNSKNGMKGPQIVKVTENGVKELLFNYEDYESVNLDSTSDPDNRNSTYWPFWLIGIGAMGASIIVVRRIASPL